MTPRAAAGAMAISPAPAIAVVFSAPALVSPPTNADPEWQARSLGWRSRELVVACPLEGLVGGSLGVAHCTGASMIDSFIIAT